MANVSMVKDFSDNGYAYGKVKDMTAGQKLAVHGRLQVSVKTAKNGSSYLSVTLTDAIGNKSTQLVFEKDARYDFLKDYIGHDVEADVYMTCVKNGAYMNMDIHNLVIHTIDPVDPKVEQETKDNKEKLIREYIMNIVSPFIRDTVGKVFDTPGVMDKVLVLPATEHSGFNYVGGLADLILNTANIARGIIDSINDDVADSTLMVNPDILMAGALLCNIGRIYTLEWDDEKTKISKTDSGLLYNDLSLAHNMVANIMKELAGMVDDTTGEKVYLVRKDVPVEILHMIDSCKSQIAWGAVAVPRSKHAMILAGICQIAFAKGLFENLEKNNPNERFVRAYDSGRAYFMPEDYMDN